MVYDLSTVSIPKPQTHLAEKALHLRIVEAFLTQIEMTLLKTPASPFDFESVKEHLLTLKAGGEDLSDERRKRIEFQLAHELLRWQGILTERDAKIEAYHMRRYCDGLKTPLEAEIFLGLARFYRDLPISRSSLSKFDLAMTRAYSFQKDDLRKALTVRKEEFGFGLSILFARWDRQMPDESHSQRDVALLERFTDECKSLNDIDRLTEVKIFDRIREFKSELGSRFFQPHVAAAAVECNIEVGNHLNRLMAEASEGLGERLGAEFDFAGALQDSANGAGTYVADVLEVIDRNGSAAARSESEDIRLLRSLLAIAGGSKAEAGENVDHESIGSESGSLSTSAPEFAAMLEVLSLQNPETRHLRRYLDTSEKLRTLDLNDFLFLDDERPDVLSRNVLRNVLCLEQIRANELHERKELSPEIKDHVMSLLADAEEFGDEIDHVIERSNLDAQGRYLIVANRLLDTRLRVERAVVRFSSYGLGFGPEIEEAEPETIEKGSTFSYIDLDSSSANRWLVGATLAVALVCAILFTTVGGSGTSAEMPEDVEIIEPARLAAGEGLSGVHRQGETLYVVATDQWVKFSNDKKTEALRSLADMTNGSTINTVLVMNSEGVIIATLADGEVDLKPLKKQ